MIQRELEREAEQIAQTQIVINHHVCKMDADDPFDTVSGTLGLTGAADSIIVLKRRAGAVTMHAHGRDIEEVEAAIQFDPGTCRWTILGMASEVHVSNERAAVLSALASAGADGLTVSEIVAATDSKSRGATDVLLFQMRKEGAIERLKRGVYAIPQDQTKIAKIRKNGDQTTDNIEINSNLSDLGDLSGPDARSDPQCEHCLGRGDVVECAYGDANPRLHRECVEPWIAAYEERRRQQLRARLPS